VGLFPQTLTNITVTASPRAPTQCSLAHCDLSAESVFVGNTDNGWRLAGLFFARAPTEVTAQFLESTKDIRSEESQAPEDTVGGTSTATPSAAFARDMHAYGVLASELLGHIADTDSAARRFLTDVVESRLLSDSPSARPTSTALLRDACVLPLTRCLFFFLFMCCQSQCHLTRCSIQSVVCHR
jgi:hypothetical protein